MQERLAHTPGRSTLLVAAGVLSFSMGLALLVSKQAEAGTKLDRVLAARTYRTVQAFPYSRFMVRGTKGFKLIISGTPISVRLIAIRRGEAVEYTTESGYVNGSGIEANFGGLGRINVRFHPNGGYTSRPLPGQLGKCHPLGQSSEQFGNFIGRIDFHGEDNFTKVRVRHAMGRAGPPELQCPVSAAKSVKSPRRAQRPPVTARFPDVLFVAGARAFSGLYLLYHDALLDWYLTPPRGTGVPFGAETLELHRGMLIDRFVAVRGGKSSLMIDRGAQTARIEPPPPFEGTSTLSECPEPEWRGHLGVRFPGKTVRVARRSGSAFLRPRHRCTSATE